VRISNFRNLKTLGSGPINWEFFADVDVTTGFFRKQTTVRRVYRKYADYWLFTDTGKLCPGLVVEELEKAYVAMEKDK
jgi:hypothetical protein